MTLRKVLSVRSPDTGDEVLRLSWLDGLVEREFEHPLIPPDVDRWIARGIVVMERDSDGGLSQRMTPPTDPRFLDHLGQSLSKQFDFKTDVRWAR